MMTVMNIVIVKLNDGDDEYDTCDNNDDDEDGGLGLVSCTHQTAFNIPIEMHKKKKKGKKMGGGGRN